MPAAFEVDGTAYVAVSLERANALALVSLAAPAAPQVLGVFPLGESSIGPEVVAIYERAGRTFVLSANEVSGDVSVFEVR